MRLSDLAASATAELAESGDQDLVCGYLPGKGNVLALGVLKGDGFKVLCHLELHASGVRAPETVE